MSKIKLPEKAVLEKIRIFKHKPFGTVRADSQFNGMDCLIHGDVQL